MIFHDSDVPGLGVMPCVTIFPSLIFRPCPLGLCVPPGDKYMVGNAVPGVVNADEKQQQQRR
jgi:hypothetical protein